MMTLFLMVVVNSGSPPWPHSRVADLLLLQRLSLNSWKLSVVFENLVVPVHHLVVQRLVYSLLILILLLLLTFLRNCGCPFQASLQRALCVRIST